MAPKADKLQQNIDSLKGFLQRKSANYPDLNDLIDKIKKLEKILAEKKLTLQIVSDNEIFSQAVFDLINKNPEFLQAYKIKYDPIPGLPIKQENQLKNTLTLEAIIADSAEVVQEYELNVNQIYTIGRAPENNIFFR